LHRVWALHLAVGAWPTWQSDITAAEVHGAFAPGGSFTWTSFGFVTSTVHAVQDEARTLWGGTGDWGGHAGGIPGNSRMAVHRDSERDPWGDQGVVRRWSGRADVAGMKKLLDGSLVSWLNHLKAAAERLR
jgi:hypothetical protein